MNWEIFLGLGEWAGAIAVLFTLIYLIRQVKLNSAQLEKQIGADLDAMTFRAYDPIYEGNNAETMVKGLRNPSALNETEQYVFDLLMYRQTHAIINAGTRAMSGELSSEVIHLYAEHFRDVLIQTPGGSDWIKDHLHILGSEGFKALGFSEELGLDE